MLKVQIKLKGAPILKIDNENGKVTLNETEILIKDGYEIVYKNGVITLKGEFVHQQNCKHH